MYRLLIVDDEPIITDGLVELFKNIDDLELDIYSAYSAVDALNWLDKVKIDIILSDICMPGMDGLALQEEVNKRWPRCRIIFLTGYSDFDFVKSAIRNNSTDYLLKTEGDTVIINSVKKAIKSLESEMKNEVLIRRAREDIDRAIPILQRDYLLDILNGAEIPLEERRQQFNQLQLELDPQQPILLLLGRCDRWESSFSVAEKNKFIYGTQNIVKEYLEVSTIIVSCHFQGPSIVWFIQPRKLRSEHNNGKVDVNIWERTLSFVQGTLDAIQGKCMELMDLSISFVVDDQPAEWENVYERFIAMRFMLNRGFGLEQEILLMNDSKANPSRYNSITKIDQQDLQRDMQQRKLEMLKNALENGEKENFTQVLKEMMKSIRQMEYNMQSTLTEVYYSLVATFITYINNWDLLDKIAFDIDLNKLTRMDSHNSYEGMISYFLELAYLIFKYRSDSQIHSTNKVISYINKYIEENVGEDISLVRLAEIVHFNPSYLSRLYKQTTGKTLSEYITQVKLEKAMEMLKQEEIKIHEVAAEVGFKTPSYFTRFFKKITNITPQEYRDLLSSG